MATRKRTGLFLAATAAAFCAVPTAHPLVQPRACGVPCAVSPSSLRRPLHARTHKGGAGTGAFARGR